MRIAEMSHAGQNQLVYCRSESSKRSLEALVRKLGGYMDVIEFRYSERGEADE